jgi:hypothetical protein
MPSLELNSSTVCINKLQDGDDLSNFSCSIDDDLLCDEFIHKPTEAKLFQKERFGITYLFKMGEEIIGYVTISMASISSKKIKGKEKDLVHLNDFPCLLIGRLGVSNARRKSHVGSYLCDWCIGIATKYSRDIGCRYVVLFTTFEKYEYFYKKCEFECVDEFKIIDKKQKVWLFQRIDLDEDISVSPKKEE